MACGIHTDGCAECWGYEDWVTDTGCDTGKWCDWGDEYPPAVPFVAISIPNDTYARGGYHGCGIDNAGELHCWGKDQSGQATPPSGTAVEVATNTAGSCALDGSGGLTCWGDALYAEPAPVGGAFAGLAGGDSYMGVLDASGTVNVWGYCSAGDSGCTVPSGAFSAISVADESCGLRADGTVDCWTPWTEPVYEPQLASGTPEGSWTAVCVGGRWGDLFACALDTTGRATCWGDSWNVDDTPGDLSFVDITCGGEFACGLTATGEVACWEEEPKPGVLPPGSFTYTW